MRPDVNILPQLIVPQAQQARRPPITERSPGHVVDENHRNLMACS
jgi:hypothetical protein